MTRPSARPNVRNWRAALLAITLVCCAILFGTFVPVVHAQSAAPTPPPASSPATAPTATAPAKSLFPPRPSGKAEAAPTGPMASLYGWILAQQRQANTALAGALRDIKAGNAFSASLVLIAFSFAYGVLHAAGPGHGKAVVSSYMLADQQTVRRGIALAFMSSAVQAVAAIVLFAVVVLVLAGAGRQIATTEAWLERASWAIVALFGLALCVRQIRALLVQTPSLGHAHHAHAGHDHAHHDHAHHDHALHAHAAHDQSAHGHGTHDHKAHAHKAHDHTAHDHKTHNHIAHNHAAGETCDTCGHAHMPTADSLQGAWSFRRAAILALGIGIRPCTGALGVLFVANGLGLMWAGVLSTFAMAIGTAITVSALAALAVSSRDLATRIAGAADNSWASRAQTAIGLAGAALVFVLGSTFFYYSLTAPTPF